MIHLLAMSEPGCQQVCAVCLILVFILLLLSSDLSDLRTIRPACVFVHLHRKDLSEHSSRWRRVSMPPFAERMLMPISDGEDDEKVAVSVRQGVMMLL